MLSFVIYDSAVDCVRTRLRAVPRILPYHPTRGRGYELLLGDVIDRARAARSARHAVRGRMFFTNMFSDRFICGETMNTRASPGEWYTMYFNHA